MFLPNMLKLLAIFERQPRAFSGKALFAAAIVYVIVPLDFIPDIFPFIGQIDDVYLVALTLLRLINRSDEKVCAKIGWAAAIYRLGNSVANLAPMLFLNGFRACFS